MSTQALTRSASLHWLRLLAYGVLSGLSLFAAACDPFLVSVCQFEDRPGCHTADPAKPDSGQPQPPREPGSPAPLGPLRRFELRASVFLGNNRRFVGLQGSPRQAVFLATDGANKWWEEASLDLKHEQPNERVRVGRACPTCPMIPATMDFARDRIYRTAERFYFFDYKSEKKVKILPGLTALDRCQLGDILIRPFVSAQYDAIMLRQANAGQFYVRYGQQAASDLLNESYEASAFAIGDLDSLDYPGEDLESLAFSGSGSYNIDRSSFRDDKSLIDIINKAIRRSSDRLSGPIQAAYIHDINNDQLPDLLFVRGGSFRVVSYRGKDEKDSPHEFGNWADDVAPAISGETVQYVAIDELTQDSYQDLIVETDNNVHFYRNVAK